MITMSRQLEELGFTKKTCITCGNDFWSIRDRKTCGDAPCDEYTFIGNPATDKKYDLYEIQKAFREFYLRPGYILRQTRMDGPIILKTIFAMLKDVSKHK